MHNDVIQRIEDFALWLVIALVSGIGWVVRRVLTDSKKIELLQAEMAHRESLRERDRQDVQELKKKIDAVHDHLLLRSN